MIQIVRLNQLIREMCLGKQSYLEEEKYDSNFWVCITYSKVTQIHEIAFF